MRKSMWLTVGCIFSLAGCGANKLNLAQICLIDGPHDVATCYLKDGSQVQKRMVDMDNFTAFDPDDASKIQAYVQKCLKLGVRP